MAVESLDHLVLPVGDLATARTRYVELGFQVSPKARHPFGTANCRVFFENRTYLEPIATADAAAVAAGIEEGLVFLQRIEAFRGRYGEGFVMAALKSADAAADHARFAAAGIALGDLFAFIAKTRDETGDTLDYGVRLAFAGIDAAPDAALFACEPVGAAANVNDGTRFTEHPNTAVGVVHVAAVAAEPARFEALVSAATERAPVRATPAMIDWDLGNAGLSVLTPMAFLSEYGFSAPAAGPGPVPGLRFAAFEIGVRNIDVARDCIGKTAADIDGRLIVPPAPGQGAFISFIAMPEAAAGAGRSDAHAGRRSAAPTVSGASVSLTPREKAFVDEMVASGRYAGTADVVRAGLKLLETREGEQPAADRPSVVAVDDRPASEPAGERDSAGDYAGAPRSIDDEC